MMMANLRLTERQTEVLKLMAQGKTNTEIADELCITRATAQNHCHWIMFRMGVRNRTAAAVYAVLMGLVCVEIDDLLHDGF